MFKLKRIQQSERCVENMYHRQNFVSPKTVESVLGVRSIRIVLYVTHNLVKNNILLVCEKYITSIVPHYTYQRSYTVGIVPG